MPEPVYRYSINNFTGDGTQVLWEFNFSDGYLLPEHVKATVQDLANNVTDRAFTWSGPFTIQVVPPVPSGHILTVYRDTPKDAPLSTYTDGAVINDKNLNSNARQAVFIAQEAFDRSLAVKGDKGEKGDTSAAEFLPLGDGAIVRPDAERLRETRSVRDFGATGLGGRTALEHLGFNKALAAVRNPNDAAFSGSALAPNGIYSLTEPVSLASSFVRLRGENGTMILGAAGKDVLKASGASFVHSDLSGINLYGGVNGLTADTPGEIATINLTNMSATAFTGTAFFFRGGLTSSKFSRLYVDSAGQAAGHGIHSDGGINNNNTVRECDFAGLPVAAIRIENLTQGWQIANCRIEGNGQVGAAQYELDGPAAVGITYNWSETSGEILLKTTGGDPDGHAVFIDGMVSIGSQYPGSGGIVGSKFSVGSLRIGFGHNVWSNPTVAPENAFIGGINKNLRVADTNVWTRDLSTTKYVAAKRRSITSEPGLTLDLFTLTRGTAADVDTNQQVMVLRVRLLVTGDNSNGIGSRGCIVANLVVGSGRTVIDNVLSDTTTTAGPLNGITATFQQGPKTALASTIQVVLAGLLTTTQNYVSYDVEVLSLSGVEANAFHLALPTTLT